MIQQLSHLSHRLFRSPCKWGPCPMRAARHPAGRRRREFHGVAVHKSPQLARHMMAPECAIGDLSLRAVPVLPPAAKLLEIFRRPCRNSRPRQPLNLSMPTTPAPPARHAWTPLERKLAPLLACHPRTSAICCPATFSHPFGLIACEAPSSHRCTAHRGPSRSFRPRLCRSRAANQNQA